MVPTIVISLEEIEQLRQQLAESPTNLDALQTIEDCEGDLEDAAISIALQEGQEPDISGGWLTSYAKQFRPAICLEGVKEDLLAENFTNAIATLYEKRICPEKLIIPVLLYIYKTGVEEFCAPLSQYE